MQVFEKDQFKGTSQNIKLGNKRLSLSGLGISESFVDLKLAMESEQYSQNISWHDYSRNNGASQVALVVKNLPANAGDIRQEGLIPVLGRSSGGKHGNALHYSSLENPMPRGAWWAPIHRVAQSWTQLKTWLKRLSSNSRNNDDCTYVIWNNENFFSVSKNSPSTYHVIW